MATTVDPDEFVEGKWRGTTESICRRNSPEDRRILIPIVSTPEDSRDREEEPEQGSKSRKGNQVEGECRCLPKTCLRKKKAIQCICLLHEYSMPPLDPL
jgi:hypothetical protein